MILSKTCYDNQYINLIIYFWVLLIMLIMFGTYIFLGIHGFSIFFIYVILFTIFPIINNFHHLLDSFLPWVSFISSGVINFEEDIKLKILTLRYNQTSGRQLETCSVIIIYCLENIASNLSLLIICILNYPSFIMS